MRILYLDCSMGAAGDMLSSALLELCADRDAALAELRALGIPGVEFVAEDSVKCGIKGTHLSVLVHGEEEDMHLEPRGHGKEDRHHDQSGDERHHAGEGHEHGEHHHHHHGRHGCDIMSTIEALNAPEELKAEVRAVYALITQAESRVHGMPVEQVHLHEVGALDAVADIAACCLLLRRLAPERVAASPVNVGGGTVRCAHGLLPVPAPATALILQGVPIYEGEIKKEMCTPTGAALLKHIAGSFGPMPMMSVSAVGCGMGSRDYEGSPNCLRAMLGESAESSPPVVELCCNLDDMTPEEIGYASSLLLEEGALDVYTVNIGMKKNRPGVQLWCMCAAREAERFRELMFRHTATLGIREYRPERYALPRSQRTVETEYGPVRVKSSGAGGLKEKPEYEDLARIARESGMPLRRVRALITEKL